MIHVPYPDLIRAQRAAELGLPFDPAICAALLAIRTEYLERENDDDRESTETLTDAAACAKLALESDALPALDNLDAAADALADLVNYSARLDRRVLAGYIKEITAELDRVRKAVDEAYAQVE